MEHLLETVLNVKQALAQANTFRFLIINSVSYFMFLTLIRVSFC